MLNSIIVIPARYNSTRFKGKPLALIHNKPMIQWVYEKAILSQAEKVYVATDDQRIFDCVIGFGGNAKMTSPKHNNGTERIGEVIETIPAKIIINLQGDEPLIPVEAINSLITACEKYPMATIAVKNNNLTDFHNPNVVKVVTTKNSSALYFSRSPIPYHRSSSPVSFLSHWGIYAYQYNMFKKFTLSKMTSLESIEMLEQLRILENNKKIFVHIINNSEGRGVDTPEDIDKIKKFLVK